MLPDVRMAMEVDKVRDTRAQDRQTKIFNLQSLHYEEDASREDFSDHDRTHEQGPRTSQEKNNDFLPANLLWIQSAIIIYRVQ